MQQDAGERLVDLVVEVAGDAGALLLHAPAARRSGAAPLGLEPLEHAPERELRRSHLLGLGAAVDEAAEVDAGARQVGALHRVDRGARAARIGAGAGTR